MTECVHTVVETPAFIRNAMEEGLDETLRARIVLKVAAEPQAGDLIRETGGLRKLRFAGRGKGKSGGYRVITAYIGETAPVFLLALYGKGRKADLTGAERASFKAWMDAMKKSHGGKR